MNHLIIFLFLTLTVLILAWCQYKSSYKERISPDPFRAAFMEMAAAKNDPLSQYLYSFGA